MSDLSTYWVTVVYVEPTYDPVLAPTRAPYRWTFEVEALDEEPAVAEAKRRFEEVAQVSAVGWVREAVRWEVRSADRG